MNVGIAKRSYNGAPFCGDQVDLWQRGRKTTLCIVDGLGHGEYAEKAAKAALYFVAHKLLEPLSEVFVGFNTALRNTRGVAMGIAVIDEAAQTLTYAGVGNTRIIIVRRTDSGPADRKTLHLRSNFGIVGGGYKSLSPESVYFEPGDLMIMYTDGVQERIDFTGYDDMLNKDVQRMAEKIIEYWGRDTDDAAVLIYKYKG